MAKKGKVRLGTKHIDALDGVRGLAILMVVLGHLAGFANLDGYDSSNLARWFEVGWAGVDLFFVLSGYLITGIVLDNKCSSNFLAVFYWRRFLRIFPLYFLLLFFSVVFFPRFGYPLELFTGSKQAFPYFCTFLYNLYITMKDNWVPGWLGSAWSLAIEEQFYFIWPMLVLIVNKKKLLQICFAFMLLAISLRFLFLMLGLSFEKSYYFTLTRLDGLAVGAVVAIAMRSPTWVSDWKNKFKIWSGWILALSTLGFLSLAYFYGNLGWWNPLAVLFDFSILAIGFGALLLFVLNTSQKSSLNKFFSNSLLRFLGKYSYGIYLLHQPIIKIFDPYCNGVGRRIFPAHSLSMALFKLVGDGFVIVLIAVIVYDCYEAHFLRLKNRFFYSQVPNASLKTGRGLPILES
jgi:peptidoglycan/LPS O-acetylase OafA/YrhL